MERLASALVRRSPTETLGVIFLDVDRFKMINDSLGHAAGDRVVKAVGHRLRVAAGDEATVARFGGDEFVVFLTDERGGRRIDELANTLAEVVTEPLSLLDGETFVTVSVGVATADRALGHGREPDARRRRGHVPGQGPGAEPGRALRARRTATRWSASNWATSSTGPSSATTSRCCTSPSSSCGPVGWPASRRSCAGTTPSGGSSSRRTSSSWPRTPASSSRSDSSSWTGRWTSWPVAARPGPDADRLTVSINLSARQLGEPELVGHVADALDRRGVDPHRCGSRSPRAPWWPTRPVTEVLSAAAGARRALRHRRLRHRLLVAQLPPALPGRVTQDRPELRAGPPRGQRRRGHHLAVTHLGHSLNLLVTAEGVEQVSQLVRLRELGCDHVQGMLIGPPQTCRARSTPRCPCGSRPGSSRKSVRGRP